MSDLDDLEAVLLALAVAIALSSPLLVAVVFALVWLAVRARADRRLKDQTNQRLLYRRTPEQVVA
jgi:hypothetical protein